MLSLGGQGKDASSVREGRPRGLLPHPWVWRPAPPASLGRACPGLRRLPFLLCGHVGAAHLVKGMLVPQPPQPWEGLEGPSATPGQEMELQSSLPGWRRGRAGPRALWGSPSSPPSHPHAAAGPPHAPGPCGEGSGATWSPLQPWPRDLGHRRSPVSSALRMPSLLRVPCEPLPDSLHTALPWAGEWREGPRRGGAEWALFSAWLYSGSHELENDQLQVTDAGSYLERLVNGWSF